MSRPATSSSTTVTPAGSTAADMLLRGRWLLIARMGWVVVTLIVLTLTAIAIPRANTLLQSVCQPDTPCLGIQLTLTDLHQLKQLGLTPGFLATYQLGLDVGTLLVYLALATLIFARRSRDRMALFCASMLVLVGGATYTGLLDDGLRPLAPAWYWPVGIVDFLGLTSLFAFLLLFPSGRFVPRWTGWGVLLAALAEAHYVFFYDQLQPAQSDIPIDFLIYVALVLSIVGLQIYRYRRVSTPVQRQQTKWVVFGIAVALLGFSVSFTLVHFFPDRMVQSQVFQTLVVSTLSYAFLLLIPISIAIAILRSRLWDIDTIINKALVYGPLTALLAALYAGLIISLESLAGHVAGPASTNPLALVVSTLAIAALVQPLRNRIQGAVDRRFYRSKYDAEKTLAAFSAALRQEVDLLQLREQLFSVVQETMQPESLSLWLRQPNSRVSGPAHLQEPSGPSAGMDHMQ
jgi:hypothetical protein